MSIKIDPEIDKAVDPESIGEYDTLKAVIIAVSFVVAVLAWKFIH